MANPVTNHLPMDIDSFLQDVAQMYGGFSYADMMKFHPTKEQIEKLRILHDKIEEVYLIDERDVMHLSVQVSNIVLGKEN